MTLYLSVPFFVTAEKVGEPIVGLMSLQRFPCIQNSMVCKVETCQLNLRNRCQVKNVDAFVNLIQTQTDVDLCNVKTAKGGIKVPAGKNRTDKCYGKTGPIESRHPVIFEHKLQECWPDGIKVSETMFLLQKGGSCRVSIPISNTTDHYIYLPPCTSLGSLQLVSSITPLDVKLVQILETSEPVNDTPVNKEAKEEPKFCTTQ